MGLCCDPLLKPPEGLITIIEKSESTKKHKWFSMFSTFLIRIAAEKDKGDDVENKKNIYFFFFISIATISHKKCCCYGRSIVELSGYCFDYIFASSFFKRSIVTIYNTPIFPIYIEVYVSFLYDILYFRFLLLCTCLDLFHITKNIAQIRIYIHRHVPHEQSAKSRKKVERMAFGCEIEHGGEHNKTV